MKTPILCRLGLHDWKPVCKYQFGHRSLRQWKQYFPPIPWKHWHFHQVGHKCRRCGKRVVLL